MKSDFIRSCKKLLCRYDVFACSTGVVLFIYLFLIARRGIGYPDEAFYLSIAQRFLQGDLPLVQEWGVEQLASLFLIIPYKLYTVAFGGTEGILLFFRYFFCVLICFFTHICA